MYSERMIGMASIGGWFVCVYMIWKAPGNGIWICMMTQLKGGGAVIMT